MSDTRPLKQILADCQRRFVDGKSDHAKPEQRSDDLAVAPRGSPGNSTIPPSFRWATLDAPELRQRVARERAIAEAKAALSSAGGLLLFGLSGSGKTSLACALLRAWGAKNGHRRGIFVPAFRLGIARAQHGLGQGEAPLVERATTARLVVVDDLGSEGASHASAVPEVIQERALAGLLTWVTTWMTPGAIAQRYGDGVARRLYEAGRVLVVACGNAS